MYTVVRNEHYLLKKKMQKNSKSVVTPGESIYINAEAALDDAILFCCC